MVGAVIGDRYRGWSDDMSFDCVVYAATRSRGLRWVIDARPTILYRQHTSNVFGANVGWRAAIMRVKLLRRGWIRQHVRSIAAYCESSPAGDEVVRRVQRGSIGDRVWLFARAGAFRRESRARLALRAFFLLGWF
jgi:rhamnosyltransferase